ncbi:MAG: hypothetical protein AAF738_11585, partial [Bacteroidota bacterium]
MKKVYFSFILFAIAQLAVAQGVFFTEDFGPTTASNWTAVELQGNGANASNWIYTTSGPSGGFAPDALASTTAENGWYLFDSDLNCSQENQEAWLVSPVLDASGTEKVFLEFETYYRSFNDQPSVEVSIDSTTWVSFEVFPGIEANDFGGDGENPQKVSIDISNIAAGEPQFWIAFRFLSDGSTQNGGGGVGCAYAWQIDDVTLTDLDPRPATDLRISSGFFAIAPNAITPASQVTPLNFMADVENVGSETQLSSTLNVSIVNAETEEEVFSDNLEYGEIEADSLEENRLFDNTFTPAAEEGVYSGAYTLIPTTEDGNPTDNTRTFNFAVSDTTFAKALQATRSIAPAGDNSYAYGNCYYVPNGAGRFARYMSFAVANPADLVGSSVTTFLYKWEGDTNEDGQANPAEYGEVPIAFNSYEFDGSEDGTLI